MIVILMGRGGGGKLLSSNQCQHKTAPLIRPPHQSTLYRPSFTLMHLVARVRVCRSRRTHSEQTTLAPSILCGKDKPRVVTRSKRSPTRCIETLLSDFHAPHHVCHRAGAFGLTSSRNRQQSVACEMNRSDCSIALCAPSLCWLLQRLVCDTSAIEPVRRLIRDLCPLSVARPGKRTSAHRC